MSSFDLFGNPLKGRRTEETARYATPSFHLAPDQLDESVEEEARVAPNTVSLILAVIGCATVLGLQCFRLQVTQGALNKSLAEGNSLRLLTVPADRGLIVDANGEVLAQNTRQLALAINPQTLPVKKSERESLYALLKEKAAIPQETLDLVEENRLKDPAIIPIKTNLSKEESLLYSEWFANTAGVVLQEIPIRQYTSLPSLGQFMGYVGAATEEDVEKGYGSNERLGKTGLEAQYNDILAGTPGRKKAVVDVYGEETESSRSRGPDTLPKPGETLKLSIDSRLQTIVADALKHELERRTKKFGNLKDLGASAVVLNPNNGAVMAMVSLPDFDNQLFAKGISSSEYANLLNNPANPLLNRTIQGQYPSGSVIKPLIAGAALQAGIVNENFQVVTPEAIYVGDFRFPDWKTHGLTNIRKAIAESNDIFFYALGGGWKEKNMQGLGIDELNRWMSLYGLGSPTGIDIPGEMGGLLGTPEWKEKNVGEPWYIGDTYHASIGQGYTLATPLQMAVSTAVVANGGTLYKPTLAWSTTDITTNQETFVEHPAVRSGFISSKNMQTVREGMRQTVETGSARPLNTLKVTSAGKTGTAEFGDKGMTHAWYTGFAPYDNPQIVFSIMIEGGGDSFYSSIPVAEEILRNYFNDPLQPGQKLNSEPDLNNLNSEFLGEH